MANVSFAYGNTVPTTSNLGEGGIYFNTSKRSIYLNRGGSIYEFVGTDSTKFVPAARGCFYQTKNITANSTAAGLELSQTASIYGILIGYTNYTRAKNCSAYATTNANGSIVQTVHASWTTTDSGTSGVTIYYIPT